MTNFKCGLPLALFGVLCTSGAQAASYWVEAEDFQFSGEWLEERDTSAQGNRILRTPGANADAITVVTLPQAGRYAVWVRARDYTEQQGKRRYKLLLDGTLFDPEFGAHGTAGWKWEKAGERELTAGDHVLALRDTAKFFGRADAVFFTTENLDPNTMANLAPKARRLVPKIVDTQAATPFAPSPERLGDAMVEVAKLENKHVRVRFLAVRTNVGKPQIVRETEININGTWQRVSVPLDGEKLFVLHAKKTDYRTASPLPSWLSEPSNAPIYRFTVNGNDYEAMAGRANPFFAAPAELVLGRSATQNNDGSVQVHYETASGLKAVGRWDLKPQAREVEFALAFTPQHDGIFSFGFSPFGAWSKEQVQFNLLPPLFQFQRLPESPVMVQSNTTPQPLALAQVALQEQAISLGVVADLSQMPFEWANAQNAAYGFSLLNADGKVQPTIFAPVLGQARSQMKKGETQTFSWRVLAFPGNWKSALEYASNEIFKVTDYRQPYKSSLSDAALNMIALLKNEEATGWNAERKGFWNIETINVASQASPLTVLSAAVLTRDEELYRTRALPSIEYTLSRPQAHFGMEVPNTHAAYINEDGTKIKVPSDFYGSTYWQGLHDLLGRKNGWLGELVVPKGEVRYRAAYSSMPRWSEMLGAYRLKPDATLLTQIKSEADKYLQSEVYGTKTRDLGIQPFYNVSYYPYWWDLLDLYELTTDKKYLDAAEHCAFFTIAGQWSHPRVPEGNITIHPGGEYAGEPHLWWKGDKPFRLGTPRQPGATPEKQVPAWLVAQVGLGLEQPSTYYASGKGGMRNILMSAWAPNLLRLYRYTGRDIFRVYARNAVISRFANYPGYYISGYTDLPLQSDYPYTGPDVTSIYYHHIPPHLAFTLDFLVTQAEQRSNGKIAFPWVKQQGYVWFTNRLYGHAPGTVFGDTARLWLSRNEVQVKSPAINYLLARGDNRLWLILMNESSQVQTPEISLDKNALGIGDEYLIFNADGTSQSSRGALAVSVPAKGLVALSFAARTQNKTEPPPLQSGRVTQQIGGEWGTLEAFRIRSPFGKDSLYVVLTGRPQNGVATLQLDGEAPQEKKNYPFEFSVYPLPMQRDIRFFVRFKNGGTMQTSPTIVLPGTPQ
jgi:hypothetical protein